MFCGNGRQTSSYSHTALTPGVPECGRTSKGLTVLNKRRNTEASLMAYGRMPSGDIGDCCIDNTRAIRTSIAKNFFVGYESVRHQERASGVG